MITLVEVNNYRALRHVRQSLSPFQILIGPNASGKSSFLDAVLLMSEVANMVNRTTLDDIIRSRAGDLYDLFWLREGTAFEIAIEVKIPDHLAGKFQAVRYELAIGHNLESNEIVFMNECLWLLPQESAYQTNIQYPVPFGFGGGSIIYSSKPRKPKGWEKIIDKRLTSDRFESETNNWGISFKVGPTRSALASLLEDEDRFPVANWFKSYLVRAVQRIELNSAAMRAPSPPQSPHYFSPDGSNLPQVIHQLEKNHPTLLKDWLEHIRTVLPDVQHIETIERPEDRYRYIRVHYQSGYQAPSWMLSDGSLRLMALTLLAYVPATKGIFLIEEPENGIHPAAIETVFQSLSQLDHAQVLLATHSPMFLSLAKPEQLLCFKKEDHQTVIVSGDKHPNLQDFQSEDSLAALFASGILG